MTTHATDPSILALEWIALQRLNYPDRGDAACARRNEIRDLTGTFDALDRSAFWAASVATIDPGHTMGPYRGLNGARLTPELLAFEYRRISHYYSTDGERSGSLSEDLLFAMDPLFNSITSEDVVAYATTRTALGFGSLDPHVIDIPCLHPAPANPLVTFVYKQLSDMAD